jgi:hypothetical protein
MVLGDWNFKTKPRIGPKDGVSRALESRERNSPLEK